MLLHRSVFEINQFHLNSFQIFRHICLDQTSQGYQSTLEISELEAETNLDGTAENLESTFVPIEKTIKMMKGSFSK